MSTHYSLTDEQFLEAFQTAKLPPELFTHEAHLRLAWLYLEDFDMDTSITKITHQIKNYTKILGAEDKYNETVTVAAIKVVYHFKRKALTNSFKDFMTEFPRLKSNFKELLAQHYGFDIFSTEEAKFSFMAPDLLPFD